MKLIKVEDRPVTRWKNGTGTTSQLAIFPPTATIENFGWRISIAQVGESGPFSIFPDVDRHLAVLDGALVLNIGDRAPVPLSPRSAPIFFAGDVPCRAELETDAVQDLNVLTRRGRFYSYLALRSANNPVEVQPNTEAIVLVALGDLTVRIAETDVGLNRLDALWLDTPLDRQHRALDVFSANSENAEFYLIHVFTSAAKAT